jgi:hypothetical protein
VHTTVFRTETIVAEPSWTILYKEALQSQPKEQPAKINVARGAILSQLQAIDSGEMEAGPGELGSLHVALHDLHVLSISVRG